jgi:hypothetical protein
MRALTAIQVMVLLGCPAGDKRTLAFDAAPPGDSGGLDSLRRDVDWGLVATLSLPRNELSFEGDGDAPPPAKSAKRPSTCQTATTK